VTNLGREQY